MHRTVILLLALFGVFLARCESEPSDGSLPGGYWSAYLELPGGSAPFGLEIGREGEGYRATLINGPERITIPVVRFDPVSGDLLLEFPAYGNRIDANYQENMLTGNLTLVKREATQTIPFNARPGNVKTSGTPTGTDLDLSGRWQVNFVEEDDSTYPAIGEFAQRGARLVGTFLTPTGDYRYLAGEVRGEQFILSTFDGAHAFLFKARQLPNETLLGEFWSGLNSYESFIAERNEQAKLPDANSLTSLNPDVEQFSFTFPNPGGGMVSLDDPQFQGKVVVVTLAGSWCPNCHDEAAFMATLYEKYKDQGLVIFALMFEHSEDFETAARQVQRFRDKFSITYQILVAGSSDKEDASEVLPQLNSVLAFPTTLFIDRNRNVRRIHTGFSGPGTGDHYTRLTKDMESLIVSLLEEPIEAVVIEESIPGPDESIDDSTGGPDETLPETAAPQAEQAEVESPDEAG